MIKWLSQFKLSDFDFTDEIDEACETEIYLLINQYDYISNYMKFDNWWDNFIELKGLLANRLY